jgi:DNA-binding transcriptional LysR family regulator
MNNMKSRAVQLDRMAAFAAVADAGSFTGAADRLGVAKSGLSQTVSALERELGIQLLHRSTRRLAVTEAGATFLADCRLLLDEADRVVERARTGTAALSGTLRITSALDSVPLICAWIAEYRMLYPAMRIEYLPTDLQLDLIEGNFDLAFRIGLMRDSRLRAARLVDVALLLVAAPQYLAQRGTPKKPADLAAHEWLCLSVVPTPWTLAFKSPAGKTSTVRMTGSISVSAAAALRSLALAGAGVAALPEPIAQADIEDGRLVRLLPRYRLPQLYFYAVYPGNMAPPAKTRAFIDLAKLRAA